MRAIVLISLGLGPSIAIADGPEASVGNASKAAPNLAADTTVPPAQPAPGPAQDALQQKIEPKTAKPEAKQSETRKAPEAAPKPAADKTVWGFPGSWRGAYEADSGIAGAPGMTRFNDAKRQRFTGGARFTSGDLAGAVKIAIYAYDGISVGDADKSLIRPAELRQGWLSWRSPYGLFRFGATENKWGLGIVSGGRSAYDQLTHDFTYRVGSDVTAGLTYGLKLGRIGAALSGAMVLRDENATLTKGDRAAQGVGLVRYSVDKRRWAGLYAAYRSQTDADGSDLTVLAIDLAGAWEGALGAADRWRIAFEAANLMGSTDRMLSEAAFAAGRDTMDLSAQGAAMIAGFDLLNRKLAVELEGGYASADRNPEDDKLTRFSFDRGHQVGMILIPSLLRHVHEAAVERAEDPSRVAQGPHGLKHLKSKALTAGVTYINPRVSWRVGSGSVRGGLHLGAIIAGLPQGSADPYMSFRRGTPTNPFGGAPDTALGSELNIGLTTAIKLRRRYALGLSLEGAAAQPGAAYADATGNAPGLITMLRTGFALRALEKEAK